MDHPAKTEIFQDKTVPHGTTLVGWSALVQKLKVPAPVRRPVVVSERHVKGGRRSELDWIVFDKRFEPPDDFAGHLSFALRHEELDLLILKRVLDAADPKDVEAMVRAEPTGSLSRRVWFFFEFLTRRQLDVRDATSGNYVDALDPERYFTVEPAISLRHRVRNNLPGTTAFCPTIRRTPKLAGFLEKRLDARAADIVGQVDNAVISRAASFLLLADSVASFEIEGERPPRNRIERWCKAVAQAGQRPFGMDELLRLHAILIEDNRFVAQGLREESVFLGERDHDHNPLPEFIGARSGDLSALMTGLMQAHARMTASDMDAVLVAAAIAFGFVYVHPFQDGNGRIHRCIINHVLAERKFSPPGMIFPVSAVMLDRILEYRDMLRTHSGPLMDFIEWRPTPSRNVEVLNDTADLYKFPDVTQVAEFLYACVERTIEIDLPKEIEYLRHHDEAKQRIKDMIEMPDGLVSDFIMFVRQNGGTLPRKRRRKEFSKLTEQELADMETVVRDAFQIDIPEQQPNPDETAANEGPP